MFRKTAEKTATPEEEISEALLDTVPELDHGDASGPFSGFPHSNSNEIPVTFEPIDEDDESPAPPTFRPIAYPLGAAMPLAADDRPPVNASPPPTPYPLGAPMPGPGNPNALDPPAPFGHGVPRAAPGVGALDIDVHALVTQARQQMDSVFTAELARVEASFGTLLKQMESRLGQAQLELAAVRAEHAKVKAENEKKVDALRELKKTLEGI